MKLVSNWKYLHKSYSVLLTGLGVLVSFVEIVLPLMSNIQPMMEPTTYGLVMFCLYVLAGVGRYIKQESIPKEVVVKNIVIETTVPVSTPTTEQTTVSVQDV